MKDSTLVKPGEKVRLADRSPDDHGKWSKDDPAVAQILAADLAALCALQERLYAESRQSLLIVLQGMDAAGKDGTIAHVMSGLNPQSCSVASFKVPTPEELAHDFLWRIHQRTPEHGHLTVFNRSHYEDVLVARVHGLVPAPVWKRRYEEINHFEQLLAASGTRIVKFFLHISNEEQKRRLEERLADPTKQWKISASDVPERARWDDYQAAYEDALSQCSTKTAPWHVIPANHKWYRNLLVAGIIKETLEDMDPQWPPPTVDLSQIVIK
ncbi:MAG TPA: polyphosphate kinase 2 family protein [Armatimonadota bacterium]